MDTNIKSNNVSDNKEKKVETSASSISTSSTTETKSNINTSQNSASKASPTVVPSNSSNSTPIINCNTKECKIRFISKGQIYFEFNKDYVLQLPLSKDFNEKDKTIKITYTSNIGKPDFKYSIVK